MHTSDDNFPNREEYYMLLGVCVCVEIAQTRPKNERRRRQNKKNAQHIVRTLGFLVHKRVKRTEYSQ